MPHRPYVPLLFIAGLALGPSAGGCSSGETAQGEPCADVAIDEWKELLVIEDSVVSDARAKNATSGAWSFRHLVEEMTPTNVDANKFVRSWLLEWGTLKTFNNYPLDRPNEQRGEEMQRQLLCPWQKRTASNGCNDDCSTCAVDPPVLDLAAAPFRLLAIVNRMDLRDQPDILRSGESRFVFGFTDGPGDDPASKPLPMGLIFEFWNPSSRTTKQWAEDWHALGKHAAFDDAYKAELETLTRRFTERGAEPLYQNGSAINQVRTNESALNWIWQLREFTLGDDGGLHLTATRNTPRAELNNSPALRDYVIQNEAAIREERFAMPASLLGGSADAFIYRWQVPEVDETLRRKLSGNTCNGCHTQEVQSVDTAFHISPYRSGKEKLSSFVYNPAKREGDQLWLRTKAMRTALCTGN